MRRNSVSLLVMAVRKARIPTEGGTVRTDTNRRRASATQVTARRSPRAGYDDGGFGSLGPSEPEPYDAGVSLQEPLLTVVQTAELLNVRASTVYYLVNIGELPHRRVGRRIRFYRPDLERYLAA